MVITEKSNPALHGGAVPPKNVPDLREAGNAVEDLREQGKPPPVVITPKVEPKPPPAGQ